MINRLTFVVLLLSAAMFAQTPATITPTQEVISLSAATTTGAGAAYKLNLVPFSPASQPYNRFTWRVTATGAPATSTVNLEGSNDLIIRADGVATAASATFTSATGNFTAADIGKEITITGAGTAGAVHVTTIAAVGSTTSITLGVAAVTSVAVATYRTARWFTLDSSTSTTTEMRHVVNKPVLFIRCNLSALTGGATPTVTGFILTAGN